MEKPIIYYVVDVGRHRMTGAPLYIPRIVHRFCQGRVIKFGSCFYARLYLDGQTDADGRLTSANSVNVRFVNGAAFRLTRDPEKFLLL